MDLFAGNRSLHAYCKSSDVTENKANRTLATPLVVKNAMFTFERSCGVTNECWKIRSIEKTSNPAIYTQLKAAFRPAITKNETHAMCSNLAIRSALPAPKYAGMECKLFFLSNSSSCNAYIMSKPLTQHNTAADINTGRI